MSVLDLLGSHVGPCGLCGGPDARHREADAICSRLAAGESEVEVAADYERPISTVVALRVAEREAWARLVRRLVVPPGRPGYVVPVHPDDPEFETVVHEADGWALLREVDLEAAVLLDEALDPLDADLRGDPEAPA